MVAWFAKASVFSHSVAAPFGERWVRILYRDYNYIDRLGDFYYNETTPDGFVGCLFDLQYMLWIKFKTLMH